MPAVKPGKKRWLVALAAAVLLHVLTLDWANRNIAVPRPQDEPRPAIAMVQLPQVTPAPAPEVAPLVKPKARPKPRFVAAPKPTPSVEAPVATDEPPAPAEASTALSADGTGKASPAPPADAITPDAPPAEKEAKADEKPLVTQYKVEFPPPAELKYDVQQVPADGSHPRYGSGVISWHMGGGKYQVTGEADVLFFTLLKFTSEGSFDNFGIAPTMYSEKRFRRPETATHFNRDERNNISFSASTLSYPLKGGEQDLSSVIWELTGIGRGDREKFVPGAQIDLFVAGVRDADIWSILVVGPESIDAGDEKTQAWHVVRIPRVGSYDKKIDIWLAPQAQWYPIKIRQTEKSGDYVDMTMKSFHALPATDAQ